MNEMTDKNDRYKWTLLGALWLMYLFLHGTRQIFAATLPQIKTDFLSLGVTDAQLGSVFTVDRKSVV